MSFTPFALRHRLSLEHGTWAVAVSPDGRLVASNHTDDKLHLRDGATGESKKALPAGKIAKVLAFSPDGRFVITGSKALAVYDTQSLKKAGSVKGHRRDVGAAAWSRDGGRIIAGGLSKVAPGDDSIRFFDAATFAEVGKEPGAGSVVALAALDDGGVVVATSNGVVFAVNADATRRWTISDRHLSGLAVSSRGAVLATGPGLLLASIDALTGAVTVKAPCPRYPVGVALVDDDAVALVAIAHGGSPEGSDVCAVDVDSGAVLWREPLAEVPRALAVSRDGKRLAVAVTARDHLLLLER